MDNKVEEKTTCSCDLYMGLENILAGLSKVARSLGGKKRDFVFGHRKPHRRWISPPGVASSVTPDSRATGITKSCVTVAFMGKSGSFRLHREISIGSGVGTQWVFDATTLLSSHCIGLGYRNDPQYSQPCYNFIMPSWSFARYYSSSKPRDHVGHPAVLSSNHLRDTSPGVRQCLAVGKPCRRFNKLITLCDIIFCHS